VERSSNAWGWEMSDFSGFTSEAKRGETPVCHLAKVDVEGSNPFSRSLLVLFSGPQPRKRSSARVARLLKSVGRGTGSAP